MFMFLSKQISVNLVLYMSLGIIAKKSQNEIKSTE